MLDIGDKIADIFSALIENIWDWFLEPLLGLSSLRALVFGKNDDGDLIWDTFTSSDLTKALAPMYNSLLALALVILVGLIVVQGIRFAKNSANPQARSELIQSGLMLLLVGLLIRFLPGIYDVLFAINGAIVDFFASTYKATMGTPIFDSATDKVIPEEFEGVSEQVVGRILVELILVGLAIWANFYYLTRKITLVILMALGPIFIVCMVHPKWRSVTSRWFSELMSTIFIQSIHALTFWFLAIISSASTNLVGTAIAYVVFIPVTVAVRNLFFMGGQMQDGISKAGAAFGLTALGGVLGAVKGAAGGKSLGEIASNAISTARGAYQNSKGDGVKASDIHPNGDVKDTIAGDAGSDTGSKKDAERMLKNGEILDRIGKGTMGAMGAIAGAGIGPAGTAALAAAGYSVGGAVGGFSGRAGTALGQTLKDKYDKAGNLLSRDAEMSDADLQNADLDTVAEAYAEKEAANWSSIHAQTMKDDLKQKFPDASEQEINQMVAKEQAQRKSQYKQRAGEQLQEAEDYGKDHISSEGLANEATQSMVKQWANDNRQSFMAQHAEENPQKPDESNEAFQDRLNTAFDNKKRAMERQFNSIAEIAVNDSVNELGHVNKNGFTANLAKGLEGLNDVENPDALAMKGAESGKSISIFNADGRLEKGRIVNALASSATLQAKEAFVAGQVARGVDRADAIQDWNTNHASTTLANNQAKFGDASVGSAIDKGFAVNEEAFVRATGQTPSMMKKIVGMGNVLTLDAVDSVGKHSTAIKQGFNAVQGAIVSSSSEGEGVLKTAKNAITSGFTGLKSSYVAQGIENAGSAVEAQANYQDKVGYVGGVLFGANGYTAAKKLGMKISPYKAQVDNEVYSPSEVAQMAQTTTDQHGNTTIASGAIRQVVTADASYIEVLTRSGERKRVSRVTAGDSGLSKDAIVYQDLDVQDNMLVPVQRGGGQSSAYHLDSGGAKVPSDVKVFQNPNTLLKQGNIQKVNMPTSIPTNPIVSVEDNATFTPNEVQQLAITKTGDNGQPQIVNGAIRQVVTADSSYIEVQGHDGKKHRVSAVGKGNSSLAQGEVLYQDLDVRDGQYVPLVNNIGGSKSSTYAINNGGQRIPTQHKVTQNPNNLVRTVESPNLKGKSAVAFPKGKDYPSFSQFVDQGQFYTDDLASQGFQNINVVVENERRFVTAQKEGITYRVSPVYAGDTRMNANEVKEIPMTIQAGKLVPQQPQGENGATAKVYVKDEQNQVNVKDAETHYSSKATDNLIISRNLLTANRSAESRKLLESARQPQGILD